MPSAEQLVQRIDRLVSLPAVYLRVRGIVEDPRSSMQDLGQALSTDPALVARLLRVVNSVHFGLMRRVETVTHAISILGVQPLHDLVLATSVASAFRGMRPAHMDVARYWRQSVLRGLLAQGLAEAHHIRPAQRLFLEGLLADIGHLVLYQTEPELAERAILRAECEQRPLHELEFELIGCDYADAGATLLEAWHLPDCFAEAVANQIQPSLACDERATEAAILHVARVMADAMARKLDDAALLERIDPYVWQRTGLKSDSLVGVRRVAEEQLADVLVMFFPEYLAAA
jgi:HD-like signal output (HDOD) protein